MKEELIDSSLEALSVKELSSAKRNPNKLYEDLKERRQEQMNRLQTEHITLPEFMSSVGHMTFHQDRRIQTVSPSDPVSNPSEEIKSSTVKEKPSLKKPPKSKKDKVDSNPSEEIKSSPVKAKPSMKKPPKSKKDKVETEEQIAKRLTKPGKLKEQEGMPAVHKILEEINFKSSRSQLYMYRWGWKLWN